MPSNKYAKRLRSDAQGKSDVYDVCDAFNVTCPATAHAIKKLLMAGQRGHKCVVTDLKESIASIERAIENATHRVEHKLKQGNE